MKKAFSQLIADCLVFIGLVTLLLFGLLRLKPSSAIPFVCIGYFRLVPFTKGLTLYQQDQPFFYNFSPYNDYFLNQEENYNALVTKEELMKGEFKADFGQNPIKKKLFYFLYLFGFYRPKITFKGESQEIRYHTEIKGNTVNIKRQIGGFSTVSKAQALGITISLDEQDFVFDQNFRLYTKAADYLEVIEKFYGIRLTPEENTEKTYSLWLEIPAQNVFIFNPNLPGVIQISANTNQKIMLNKIYHLIAVEEKGDFNDEKIESLMTIKILDGLEEIRKSND